MAGIISEIGEVENNSEVHFNRTNTTSLRPLGLVIGPYITEWYNTLFHSSANIVAVDFIDATGIVEVALQWNDWRTSPCYYHQYIQNLKYQ